MRLTSGYFMERLRLGMNAVDEGKRRAFLMRYAPWRKRCAGRRKESKPFTAQGERGVRPPLPIASSVGVPQTARRSAAG